MPFKDLPNLCFNNLVADKLLVFGALPFQESFATHAIHVASTILGHDGSVGVQNDKEWNTADSHLLN